MMPEYRAFAGYSKLPEWLGTHWLWSLFAKDADKAKRRYRDFVESVQNQEIENSSKDIVSGVILGGADFVNWVKQEILDKESNVKERPQLRGLKSGPTAEDLISVVCEEFDCEREAILRKGKKRNLARDLAIYLSREMTAESGVALGRLFGSISGAGIAVRYNPIPPLHMRVKKSFVSSALCRVCPHDLLCLCLCGRQTEGELH